MLFFRRLFSRISSLGIGKKTCCAMFLALQLLAARAVRAYDVTVVESDDNTKLYNDALEGFKDSCDGVVRIFDLSKGNSDTIAREIVEASPDAVVAIGSKAYNALKAIKTLPLFTMLVYPYDPAKERNIWWVSTDIHPGKYIGTAAELLPRIGRLGLIINPALSGAYSRELLKEGREKGLQIIIEHVSSARAVPAALSLLSGKIDLLMMIPDTTVAAEDSVLSMVAFSYQNNIPLMTFSRKFLKMGGLLSLEIDPYDIGMQTGGLVNAVLKNSDAKPAGVYYARKALLVINRKIAAKLGIRIPDHVLKKAKVLQ